MKQFRYIILYSMLLGNMSFAYASGLDVHTLVFDVRNVLIFFTLSAVIFFCVKGIRSCFKGVGYDNFCANYFTEKMNEGLHKHEMSLFDVESAKRVKKLMELKKKSEFVQGSTINQFQKNKKVNIVTSIK